MKSATYFLIMAVVALLSSALAAGSWYWHPILGVFSLMGVPIVAMLNGARKGAEPGRGWFFLFGILAASVFFFLGIPTYATRAKIAASVERCVPSKGKIDPCLDEADTLHGYRVSASSLEGVDWRKAIEGCIRLSGVKTCVEDFANHGVAGAGVVTREDIAAICAGAESRTGCLLDLADKGYPFGWVKIEQAAADGTSAKDASIH
jgi:hypothetical protein